MPLFTDHLLGLPLDRAVAQDLDETDDLSALADRAQFAHRPETAPVFAEAPAFLAAAPTVRGRIFHFFAQLRLASVRGKDPVQGLAEHFGFAPAKDPARAGIPAGDESAFIGADDGRISRAIDDLTPLGRADFIGRACEVVSFDHRCSLTNVRMPHPGRRTPTKEWRPEDTAIRPASVARLS